MCGISGIYHLDYKPIETNILEKMTNLARHRGPDDEGYVLINSKTSEVKTCFGEETTEVIREKTNVLRNEFSANIGFGFRRLSIIDLSESGHQPMSISNGNYWIIFNGEIYNYIELRDELESNGIEFQSQTDTEVILQSYRIWGAECVSKFNGMWAFSIWDSIKGELFCSRDRFGIKPFYFSKTSSSFKWASEIKQLIKTDVSPVVNHQVVYHFLRNARQNISDQTFFKGISELRPGHNLVVSSSDFKEYPYWELSSTNLINTNSNLSARFLDILKDSIRIRLRSDVPIGISLSGGLDSSTIACIASSIYPDVINTFSVYYEGDKRYDEREFINEVLKQGNFKPTYFTSDFDINLSEIERMIYYHDEPCLGASPYSAFENHRNISKSGIKVILNGQGADELLGGYSYYFKYLYLDLIKNLSILQFFSELGHSKRNHKISNKAIINTSLKVLLRLFLSDKILKTFEATESSTSAIYSREFGQFSTPIILKKKFKSELTDNLYQTLTVNSIPHLLHWEDRNSMAHSVESRVPFLDFRLVEFMFSLGNEQKLNAGETKVILRESTKGILPEKIRTRQDKIGFATPTDLWTQTPAFQTYIMDRVISQGFKERSIYNSSRLEKAIKKQQLKANELWRIASLEMWYDNL